MLTFQECCEIRDMLQSLADADPRFPARHFEIVSTVDKLWILKTRDALGRDAGTIMTKAA